MSVRVSSWAWTQELINHRGDLLVLLVLADHAQDDGGGAYPSVGSIAKKARLTRRGVQLALRRLEALGVITATDAGGRHRAVTYRIVMSEAKSLRREDAAPRGEVTSAQGRSDKHLGAKGSSPEPTTEPTTEPGDASHLGEEGGLGMGPVDGATGDARPRRGKDPAEKSEISGGGLTPVEQVFAAWTAARDGGRGVLTDQRRRLIVSALKAYDLADCVDAVRGWRHSPHHRGDNKQGRVYDSIELLLRDAEHIELFRDLQRRHSGAAGVETSCCPGTAAPAALAATSWSTVTEALTELVDEDTYAVWLSTLHPHGENAGALAVGVSPPLASWVGERFKSVLEAAAGRPVTVVPCGAAPLHSFARGDLGETAGVGTRPVDRPAADAALLASVAGTFSSSTPKGTP